MILGIDVGGTHTDAVLVDGFSVLKKAKVLTDERNLLNSLLSVSSALVDETVVNELERVVLSTTISTNAIVQNKVDRVGMLVVSGPGLPPSLYDVNQDTYFLSGYTNHRGIEMAPVNRKEAVHMKDRFRTEGIINVGIVGKFSTRNPSQEIELQRLVSGELRHVSLGHRMSGHLNFPRRIATTYLNESIWSIHQRFVKQVIYFVKAQGIGVPIYILKADGGTFDITQSLEFPVQTILSGPAASIMGIITATDCRSDAIALDIGGTTTDISVFADGVPLFEPFGITIEGHKTLIRGLRTRSIGVGGDSVAKVRDGKLVIGPEREGPAAAFGGPLPTPTDAMILLGMSDIGNAEKAAAAMAPLAGSLGLNVRDAAQAVFREACNTIAFHVRKFINEINNRPVYTIHEMLDGKRLAPKLLYVVGGPAAIMAPELGRILDCSIHVPAHAESANAIGAALARTTAELTLIADTEQQTLTISEDGLQTSIPSHFTMQDAVRIAKDKLRSKVLNMGASEHDLEIETVEAQEFNMIREFYTTGRNIRVKVQIKPGTIADPKGGRMPRP